MPMPVAAQYSCRMIGSVISTRVLRGVTYNIVVERAGPGNAASLTVDGQPVAGTLAPFPAAGRTSVDVRVALQ